MIKIGSWEFTPSTGLLSSGHQTKRLEHRASSLLELLCQSDEELVTHSDIIDKIWDGRSISPNSVAVVIADIRRELGDDARNPEYIETLHKRGYRVIAPVTHLRSDVPETNVPEPDHIRQRKTPRNSLWVWLGILLSLGALLASALFLRADAPNIAQKTVWIAPIENKTESPDFKALAQALSELTEAEIMRTGHYKITPAQDADLLISGSVILWNDHAAMSLRAQSSQTQAVIWSGMASGPEARLPSQVRREILELTQAIQEAERKKGAE